MARARMVARLRKKCSCPQEEAPWSPFGQQLARFVDGDAWRPRAEPLAATTPALPPKPVSKPELHCSRRRCRIATAKKWRAQHSDDIGDVDAVGRRDILENERSVLPG